MTSSMAKRVIIYARYSSELQSARSIDDQVALCRKHATKEGWTVVDVFSDQALSGATMERPGLASMVASAKAGKADIVLTEALDRLSRDQEDIAGLYKRMSAWQLQIITLSEGLISELHVGLKGTMNALFLKDLAAKSLRGQLGKAREGMAAGGIPYGYAVVREVGDDGEIIRGKRKIVEHEAEIVRRIYAEFAAGRSSLAIAKGLNAENIPSPRGGTWNPSTIQGHRTRGVGMLTNPLYVGRQVFNRHAFVRDPDSGTRRARAKDESEWVEADVPELAIVDETLWKTVQARISAASTNRPEQHRRPKRLFSGLLECSECGGKLTIAYRDRYGCSNARQKGVCCNNRTMSAPEIEKRILNGLQTKMMEPELVEAFIDEYRREAKKLEKDATLQKRNVDRERQQLTERIGRLVDAISDGSAANVSAVGEKLQSLEGRLSELEVFTDQEPPKIEWHADVGELYKSKITDLQEALTADSIVRDEATSALRGLVEKVVAYPAERRGQFDLELHGLLAEALILGMHGNVGGGRGIRTLDTGLPV